MMKLVRLPVVLFCILFACDGSENFPDQPVIEFKSIEFSEEKFGGNIAVSFYYQDGDGDLGRAPGNYNSPYNMFNAFVIAEGVVAKYPLEPDPENNFRFTLTANPGPPFQHVLTKSFIVDNNVPGYPTYSDESACDNYFAASIKPSNADMMPSSQEMTDGYFYDTLLIERNENFYNLIIDFFVQEEGGSFEKWEAPAGRISPCTGSYYFYQILPVIKANSNYGMSQIHGDRYSGRITTHVRSLHFKSSFQNKKVKLQIQIIDNAQHKSNIVETDVLQF